MILAVGGLILQIRFQSKSSAYAAKHSSLPLLKLNWIKVSIKENLCCNFG